MKMINGYEIPELAEIKEVEVVVQQVVINNEVKNVTEKTFAIVCPHCGRVIYQFPMGISKIDAYKSKQEGKEELLKIATYCPNCGTKLYYGCGEEIVINENEESLS